jgi:hypothetical protein
MVLKSYIRASMVNTRCTTKHVVTLGDKLPVVHQKMLHRFWAGRKKRTECLSVAINICVVDNFLVQAAAQIVSK